MTTMIVEVYDALKAAGAPEDKAQAAAKVLAITDERFDRIDARFDRVDQQFADGQAKLAALQIELAALRAELSMVKWVVGGIGFGVLMLVVKTFLPAG
jgi:hypothetical protein